MFYVKELLRGLLLAIELSRVLYLSARPLEDGNSDFFKTLDIVSQTLKVVIFLLPDCGCY